MVRKNNTWLLIILVVLLIGFGLYTVWGHKKKPTEESVSEKGDIEYVPSPDDHGDDIEIIEAAEDPAFQVGFGTGPGIYGSGRYTSEMIGN